MSTAGERSAYAERVLAVVAQIPRGWVMTYGDVADFMGEGGPRAVGAVMRTSGGSVPWHRVVMADGRPSPASPDLAAALLVDDDTPMRADGARVDLALARWDGSVTARKRRRSRL